MRRRDQSDERLLTMRALSADAHRWRLWAAREGTPQWAFAYAAHVDLMTAYAENRRTLH